MTDGDMLGTRPLSGRWWRQHRPTDGGCRGATAAAHGQASTGPWGSGPFVGGLTSGSGPFPAAPHQSFNFQLDLLLSHGNGMQMWLGLPGSRLRPASRSPSLGVIPSQIRWPVVPGVRGWPCLPAMEQQPPSAQADHPHCSHIEEDIRGWVSPGLSSGTDPCSSGLPILPCPPATLSPPWHGQSAHPGDPRCTAWPVLAVVGTGSPALAG